jgi:hypothetical protein
MEKRKDPFPRSDLGSHSRKKVKKNKEGESSNSFTNNGPSSASKPLLTGSTSGKRILRSRSSSFAISSSNQSSLDSVIEDTLAEDKYSSSDEKDSCSSDSSDEYNDCNISDNTPTPRTYTKHNWIDIGEYDFSHKIYLARMRERGEKWKLLYTNLAGKCKIYSCGFEGCQAQIKFVSSTSNPSQADGGVSDLPSTILPPNMEQEKIKVYQSSNHSHQDANEENLQEQRGAKKIFDVKFKVIQLFS